MSESKQPQVSQRHVVASAAAMATVIVYMLLHAAVEPGSAHDDAAFAAHEGLPTAQGRPA